jgi:sucrose-6-phosphate hydrolase SacC (GH32 family)
MKCFHITAVVAVPLAASQLGDVSQCVDGSGLTPCRPGFQTCPPGNFGADTPQFHVKDASCGENDPNGPSYDPVHGVYHLHYQNHVGLHGGRTYGHAVSKDLTKWAHMPVSIWNDQFYDSSAIYTGSATIVDGKVVQVYPGLCKTGVDGCPGGTNLCIAKPADTMDQLQTNWTKDAARTGAVNPIVNNTGRDPTTAWQVEATGEWRLSTFDTTIYGSMDFRTWYTIGKQP